MSKWFKFGIVGMLVVGAIAVLITGVALAQDVTPTTPTTPQQQPWGRGLGRGLGGQVGAQVAAEALGMTVDEMNIQLWGGKTLADLAEEKGVALADVQAAVQSAVQAAQETALRAAIDQAVADGTITQENADWLIQGIDKGFIPGFGIGGMHRGFGEGFGEGFDRGHHGAFGGAFPATPIVRAMTRLLPTALAILTFPFAAHAASPRSAQPLPRSRYAVPMAPRTRWLSTWASAASCSPGSRRPSPRVEPRS